ncbi:ChaN family lipoprotein [Myroides injenensis]|uniref:ChaN family lipoprotein n=1 Tax=Myroides injenensis TaxID=1183151 RepID=UPI0002885DFC|nr:ChaN family lipoprotein [Myroides injenensis]
MRNTLLILVFMICSISFAQNGQPFQIYNSKGKKVSYKKMIKELAKSDVVLFGEYHNNSLGHWLQLQVTKSLNERKGVVLGAEMFEADNQEGLSKYVDGTITNDEFKEEVRLWNNYEGDYKPLVEYAKSNGLDFIATNVPRRYASLLFKQGEAALDSLSDTEKSWIAPLPFPYDGELPGYKNMMAMFEDHANDNFPKAQAIKDATMGHFITQNIKSDKLFLHFNGSYHSNNYEGIFWYLNKYNPALRVSTITMVESEDVDTFASENKGLANFIIVIEANILKTF